MVILMVTLAAVVVIAIGTMVGIIYGAKRDRW